MRVWNGVCGCGNHFREGQHFAEGKCAAAISQPPHYLHEHQCSRKAVELVRVDASTMAMVCKQHAKKVKP